ncbi:peptidoglycan DD-metalloendopeptidase family protein [Flavobacteriales bacterium]|nr:peptidoglycan DD-metalloendopeptidase family protein [Flavobacteriales bacterium]
MHIRSSLVGLFLVFQIVVFGNGEGGNGVQGQKEDIKDTIPAFVMYGSKFLLDSLENFDEISIIEYRDSLKCYRDTPKGIIHEIDLFLSIKHMRREQVYNLIDSLFEAERIPYALINQISLYVASNPTYPEDEIIMGDTSFYPAHHHYGSWNTEVPHPYSVALSKGDTTIELILKGRGKSNGFQMPVVNTLTSKFGWREGRPHNGIDLDLEVWDTVRTAFPGMVRVAKYYGGYGRVVVVRHYNGLETLYAHLHRLKVQPGDTVQAGELVGLGGSSGHSTGSHLHFECRYKGVPLNPLAFIDYDEQALLSDTLVLKKTQYGYAAFPAGTKFYVVEKGDSLFEIAKRFGTTTNKLAELNGIRRNQYLIVGQSLRVI